MKTKNIVTESLKKKGIMDINILNHECASCHKSIKRKASGVIEYDTEKEEMRILHLACYFSTKK